MDYIARPKVPNHEIRMTVITSSSNKINLKNEGVKHSSYQRFLAKKIAQNLFVKDCSCELTTPIK
jgi:hypothetical protein